MQPNNPQEPSARPGTADPQFNTLSVTGADERHYLSVEKMELEKRMLSGANWFYWIAGLSLINSVIMLFNGRWSFLAGLGITQIIDAIANQISAAGGSGANIIALMMDIIVAGFFVFFGFMARKRQAWAFITGMVLYFLDALIFLLVQGWLSIAFHILALYYIYQGLRALNQLRRVEQERALG
jgi:hypothetical protein